MADDLATLQADEQNWLVSIENTKKQIEEGSKQLQQMQIGLGFAERNLEYVRKAIADLDTPAE